MTEFYKLSSKIGGDVDTQVLRFEGIIPVSVRVDGYKDVRYRTSGPFGPL